MRENEFMATVQIPLATWNTIQELAIEQHVTTQTVIERALDYYQRERQENAMRIVAQSDEEEMQRDHASLSTGETPT